MRPIAAAVLLCIYAWTLWHEMLAHRPWEAWFQEGSTIVEEKVVLDSFDNLELSKITRKPAGRFQSGSILLRLELKKGPALVELSQDDVNGLSRVLGEFSTGSDKNHVTRVDLSGMGNQVEIVPSLTAVDSKPIELLIEHRAVELDKGELAIIEKRLKCISRGDWQCAI